MDQDASIFVVKSRKGYETKRKLVQAARDIISERGIAALTAAAVCEEVGLKRSSFYTHFDGVSGLLDALSTGLLEEIGRLSAAATIRNVRSASILERRIRFVLQYCGDNPRIGSILLDLFRQHPPTAREIRDRLMRDLTESLARKEIQLPPSKRDAFSRLLAAGVMDCVNDLEDPETYAKRAKQTVNLLMGIVAKP